MPLLDPAMAIARAHAYLRAVAAGHAEPGISVYRPAPTAAFGRIDARAPGFPAATGAARDHGFAPVLRVVGGRVAVYTAEAIVIDAITRVDPAAPGIDTRFATLTSRIVAALQSLGLDARCGELPGEYCPGTYSINLAGAVKIAGVGQRVIGGAALASAVIIVGGGPELRAALTDIQAQLGVDWEPTTAGAIIEHAPQVTVDAVRSALDHVFNEDAQSVDTAELRRCARSLVAGHQL